MGDETRATKEKAGKYAQKGQIKRALKEYEKLLQKNPGDAWTLHRMAELRARRSDKKGAVDLFIQAADAYSEEGFSDRAVAIFKQALSVDSTCLEANMRLADEYATKGFERDAVCHLFKAASVYQEKQMSNLALEVLRRSVELAPGELDCRLHLARFYARHEQPDKAREEFLQAAMELKKAGRMDEFVTVAERAIRLGAESLELHHALAGNFIERGECQRAIEVLEVPMRIRSDDFVTLRLSARAHLGTGNTSRAVSIYKRLVRLARNKGDTATSEEAQACLEEIRSDDGSAISSKPPSRLPARENGSPNAPLATMQDDEWQDETERSDPGAQEIWEEDTDRPAAQEMPLEADEKTMLVAIDDLLGEINAEADSERRDHTDPAGEPELKEGIEEADFFIGQGLLEEAGEILAELDGKYPDHPEVTDRLDEIQRLKDIGWMDDTESIPP